MFRVVMDERKKREFDPTMRMLHECIAEAEKDKATDEYTEERLRELYKFFETTTALYVQVRRWPTAAMFKFMKTGDKVLKVLRRWVPERVRPDRDSERVLRRRLPVLRQCRPTFRAGPRPAPVRAGAAANPRRVSGLLGVPEDQLLDEMRLRLHDGTVFGGAAAVVEIARRIWWAWPLWALSRLPGAMRPMRATYRWIARHRSCVNGACEIDAHDAHRQWDSCL